MIRVGRLRRDLLVWSILLAPWGVPCDRFVRAAEPPIRFEPSFSIVADLGWRSGRGEPSDGSGSPARPRDLLVENENEEESEKSESQCIVGSIPFILTFSLQLH